MRVALVGLGTTGLFIARGLGAPEVSEAVLFDVDDRKVSAARQAVDPAVRVTVARPETLAAGDRPEVTILAGPVGTHLGVAREMLEAGSHVVSLSDGPEEVEALLALDPLARARGLVLAVGAAFSPGLSCWLARWAGDQLDSVDAINVARAGTAGPACARQHHRALKSPGRDWVPGGWEVRRGGSGRDLAWFPEPFGARDCYRGALPSPILLQPHFAEASRISARMAATRRDRFTSWLPMLRPPHNDGGPGGIRVEVRGRIEGRVETIVAGFTGYPSFAAAAVAAVAARAACDGRAPVGAGGLAGWDGPGQYLAELRAAGVEVSIFAGAH